MSYSCRYPGCNRVFTSKLGRSVHERQVHGKVYKRARKETKYMCPYCEKPTFFENELTLQIHLDQYHGEKSDFLEWCERKSFENLVYLNADCLSRIHSCSIHELFGEREITKLLREGVLEVVQYGRMGKETVYDLSDAAFEVLTASEFEDVSSDEVLSPVLIDED